MPASPRRPRASAPPAHVAPAVRAKVLAVHRRLCAEYQCPIGYFHDLDPLSELVSSLLSHRTKNKDSGRAFRQLRAAFASWPAVRDAHVEAVQAAITPATWPEQKAPRIQATLREITRRLAGTPGEALGEDALDFLAALPVREARDWLERIPGVGPKTSAAVLAFSRLRRPALPVDSHHHRVAVRLGLIPASVDVGPAHAWLEAQLPADWDAQQVYDHHEVLMLHGQHVCFWRDPACARCVVRDLCPTGRERLGVDAPGDLFADAGPTDAGLGLALGDAQPAHARPAVPAPAAPSERPLPPHAAPPRTIRARRPPPRSRPMPQEQLSMSVHPHPGAGPAPERGDHNLEGAREAGRPASAAPDGDGGTGGAAAHAHGTHGKGDSRERLHDEVAVDTGDDPQFRRGGAGPNEAPDPAKFAKHAEGRMGGAGWGSEAAGGSAVDRRPNDKRAHDGNA